MEVSDADQRWMKLALEIAGQGQGAVEPNPMVGCVIVKEGEEISRGFHRSFGGKHAEIEALDACRADVAGATVYVTLEPCTHTGKTPPCVDRLIASRVSRVVVGQTDPFPQVSGQGLARLSEAGIRVMTGVLEEEARQLIAPFRKCVETGRPWILAKWAMTLDGRIATRTGNSQWISNTESRKIVHQLRGRVDGVIVGSQTVHADDPLLTARPGGHRTATRIVVDSMLTTPTTSQLVTTATQAPVLIAVGPQAARQRIDWFRQAGCQVEVFEADDHRTRLQNLLELLGEREMTNVLVEGGAGLLGNLLDLGEIDEVHAFIGPMLVGGSPSPAPIAGEGIAKLADALRLDRVQCQFVHNDVYVTGRVRRGRHD